MKSNAEYILESELKEQKGLTTIYLTVGIVAFIGLVIFAWLWAYGHGQLAMQLREANTQIEILTAQRDLLMKVKCK
jgi:hypothetical protein